MINVPGIAPLLSSGSGTLADGVAMYDPESESGVVTGSNGHKGKTLIFSTGTGETLTLDPSLLDADFWMRVITPAGFQIIVTGAVIKIGDFSDNQITNTTAAMIEIFSDGTNLHATTTGTWEAV